MGADSTLIGKDSPLGDAGSILTGSGLTDVGSALTVGVASVGVAVSIGSLIMGLMTKGSSLIGLGTIGIGFSMALTGFPVGSGAGVVLIIDGTGEALTTRGSRS